MAGINIQTLPNFLQFHQIKKDGTDRTGEKKISTHTRIGGKVNGEIIYGGNYHIPEENMIQFYSVFVY